ncbi:MAG: DUF4838 domain-containing protein [Ruminococcaceae bacterium]|nr:DUF4838 domain-containing protein [Oscillospiraceae bacterium]
MEVLDMKKAFAFVLSLILLASILISSISAGYTPAELDEENFDLVHGIINDNTYELGDVNSDKSVNAMDSLTVKATIAGLPGYECVTDAADFDADGQISPVDSYNLKLVLAGKAAVSDYEGSNNLYRLTIGGYDISDFSIVIEEDCLYSENEYMAAELFREHIPAATGVNIPIERGTSSRGHGIYIHDVDKSSELGQELGQEGYKYEVTEGDLHIYGTDRGNMYAAYEIIEDYLGFGFIENYYMFLYKQRSVDIEEGTDVTFVPGYRFRQSKTTFNSNEMYRTTFHLPRGINGAIGFDFKNANIPASYYGNFVGTVYIDIHSMDKYHRMATGTMPDESFGNLEQRYYQKYLSGEFKDETKWEPCATDEEQYKKLFTGLLEYIEFVTVGMDIPLLYEDGTNCFSFSPCDNMNWCACRNCTKEARKTSFVDIYLNLKNRGAVDVQEYYPGLKLSSLMYEKQAPVEVVPDENLILILGGTSCANHPLGTDEECHGNGFYGMSRGEFEEFIDTMVGLCNQTGAELWLWYYPETNNWWIYDIPNIYTIYHDVTWLYQHGVTGFYYEGHNLCPGYNFENMKAYMYSQVAFDPTMSLERYEELMKDYMYKVYGHGWENMWEFMQMYVEAGDLVGYEGGNTEPYCYVGAYNRAFDFVSFEYIAENYEYMRELIISAINEFDPPEGGEHNSMRIDRLYRFLCTFDLLGLGATYVENYLNGDEASRAAYAERYEETYNYYFESGMRDTVYSKSGIDAPSTCNLDSNPFLQFTAGSVRPHITEMLKGN